jgi:hypothetical protein
VVPVTRQCNETVLPQNSQFWQPVVLDISKTTKTKS